MKTITFILVLVGALAFGYFIQSDPGYMLISYKTYTMELPLWFGVVAIIAAFLALILLIKILAAVFSVSSFFSTLKSTRQRKNAHKLTNLGLIELAEGHFNRAENYLSKSATLSETPLLNYLSAAQAAGEQGAADRRDNYLSLAHDAQKGSDIAVGLTSAKLQLQNKQYEQSLATLEHLYKVTPKHTHVLKLLKQVYLELGEWRKLLNLLPKLSKNNIITSKENDALTVNAYNQLLNIAKKDDDIEKVNDVWDDAPRSVRANPIFIKSYVSALLKADEIEYATSILKSAIKHEWNDSLVAMYGLIKSENVNKQLVTAENWLKNHPQNPVLLLALARIALYNSLWGKAKRYLEDCIKLENLPEANFELGRLLEYLGENEKSLECYRHGLASSTSFAKIEAIDKVLEP